ncbi:MAG TPA: methyltransferase [Byssovorax sp.]|jgi:tRNA1(Val) A37 N6-methylase TrmN6
MEDVTIDAITAGFTLAQRRRGHRTSTDDLLTGWYAMEQVAAPARALDLGSGVGSVALLVAWRAPEARIIAVEAQDESVALLRENVARNGLDGRVTVVHADLREGRFADEACELVTGTPPYFDVRAGVVPADSQKAHARFELRGDVRDYAIAARAALAPGGRFVFCFPSAQRPRAETAVVAAGLAVVRAREVVPRAGLPPLFTLFACALAEEARAPATEEPPHVVRGADGAPTAAHAAARATFGFGP